MYGFSPPTDHVLMSVCGAVPAKTWAEAQDRVTHVIRTFHDGELALLYDMLHNLGYRKDSCPPKIAALRKSLGG